MDNKETHIDIFIAYARKDKHFLDELRIYLKPLHRNKTIKIWYDGEILPGSVWEKDIKASLHNADIVLLLVSAYSLDSDYFYDTEMTEALERHERGETIVVPVIISDCTWELTDLQKLQALPTNGKALNSWDDESKGYTDIVRGLLKNIDQVKKRRDDRVIAIKLAEEEELRKAEEEQRLKAEKEAKKKVEEEQKLKEELETKRDKEEQRLKDELEAIRQEREELNKRKVEEELKLKEKLEFKKQEKEKQLKVELEAKRKAEEEQQLKEELESKSQNKDQRPTKKISGDGVMKSILKAKNMITLRRLGIYLFAWLLLVIITGLIAQDGLLKPIDQKVYRKYFNIEASQEEEDPLLKKFVFIDIPVVYSDTILSKEQKRLQTVRLLNTIDSMINSNSSEGVYPSYYKKPTIILDISYSADMVAVSSLKASLANHIINKVKVYAAYPAPKLEDETFYKSYDAKFNSDLYDNFFEGNRLHTETLKFDDPCIRSYQSFIEIKRQPVESLINRVAIDQTGLGQETDFSKVISNPINTFGLKNKFGPRTYEFKKANNSIRLGQMTSNTLIDGGGYYKEFDTTLDLNGAFIIIGQFDDDLHTICKDKTVPGPYLVGSGIINKLIENKTLRESLDNVPVQLGMALLFPLLVCVFFALIYKYVNSLKTKPLLISSLSLTFGLLLLVGFGFALLQYAVIRPAFPLLGMFCAALLAWHFARKFLVTGIIEGDEVYDVFISSSYGDRTWVKYNLFNPLNEIEKPDGSKLNIFFDDKSIGKGELFTTKYMRAIVNSKLFIPVMSEDYYRKNHCKNEMDLAVKRYTENLIDINIIALDYKFVPEHFMHFNFIDLNNQTDFISILKKKLVEED